MIQLALCLAVAGNNDEAQRVLAPALRTCAALGLGRLLIDEGPLMQRLAKDTAVGDELSSADRTNIQDFVFSIADTRSEHAAQSTHPHDPG
jgi:serine/threonine-protein kinase PknK